MVLERFRAANLKLKPLKCKFACKSIKYLGHTLTSQGISPDSDKVTTVKKYPIPTTLKQLRSFLGLASYYRSFVKNFSQIANPLNNLMKKDVSFTWTSECQKAFDALKTALITAPVLIFPDYNKPFILQTDASKQGLGVVLAQEKDGRIHPCAYAARSLLPAERNYSVTRLEFAAVMYAIDKFSCYLRFHPFVIETDHIALKYIWSMKSPQGQTARWLEKLADYKL